LTDLTAPDGTTRGYPQSAAMSGRSDVCTEGLLQTGCGRTDFASECRRAPLPDSRLHCGQRTGVLLDLPVGDEPTTTWWRFMRARLPATASVGRDGSLPTHRSPSVGSEAARRQGRIPSRSASTKQPFMASWPPAVGQFLPLAKGSFLARHLAVLAPEATARWSPEVRNMESGTAHGAIDTRCGVQRLAIGDREMAKLLQSQLVVQ